MARLGPGQTGGGDGTIEDPLDDSDTSDSDSTNDTEESTTDTSTDTTSSPTRRTSVEQKADQIQETGDRDTDPTPRPTERRQTDTQRQTYDDVVPEDEQRQSTGGTPGDAQGTGLEDVGGGYVLGSEIASGEPRVVDESTARDRLMSWYSEETGVDQSAVSVEIGPGGEATFRLTESGAQQYQGDAGAEVGSAALPTAQDVAGDLEQQVIDETAITDASDVRIVESNGTLEARYSYSGKEKVAAEDLGVTTEDIDIRDGKVVPTTAEGRAAIIEQSGSGLAEQGDGYGGSLPNDSDLAEQSDGYGGEMSAQERALLKLEQQVNADLDREDVDIRREDNKIVATLSDAGEQTVAAANAPLKGTPVEEAFEAGARLGTQYEQFRDRNVERAQDEIGSNLVLDEPRFLSNARSRVSSSNVGERVAAKAQKLATISPEDIFTAATGDEPAASAENIDVTGGTLPVFSSAGGGGSVVGSARAAAAGTATGTALLGVGVGATGERPSATAEVPVPADGNVFEQNELGQPTSTNQDAFGITEEVPVPDPSAQETGPIGVPEEGITIDVSEDTTVTSTTELGPSEPVTSTELELPESESQGFVEASATATETDTGSSEPTGPTMPGNRLPTGGELGGDVDTSGGLDVGRTRDYSNVRYVGRGFDESSVLDRPGFTFSENALAATHGLSEPALDRIAEAQDRTVGSEGTTGPAAEVGPTTGVSPNVGPAPTSVAPVDVLEDTPAVSEPWNSSEFTDPALTEPMAETPAFDAPNVNVNAEVSGFAFSEGVGISTTTETPRPQFYFDDSEKSQPNFSEIEYGVEYDNPIATSADVLGIDSEKLGSQ